MEFIEIGCTPNDEDCFPAGHPLARAECLLYKRLLEEVYPPPDGAYFRVRANPHDFGTYYEVAAYYDESEESHEWAFRAEAGVATWPTSYKKSLKETANATY